MRVLSTGLVLASVGFAWAMHRYDAKLQRFRKPSAGPPARRVLPVDWRHPERFSEAGEPLRLAVIKAWWRMFAAFVAAFGLFLVGL